MMYRLWITLLIFLKILTFIRGYPDGAPERACFIMVPRHTHPHTYRPIFKQFGPSPYNITLSRPTWRSDRPLRVTITGAPFKGFMLTACEDGHQDWPTGMFYSESPDARTLWCVDRNDGITHNNSNWKSSVTVLWYGPRVSSADHVVFLATVVTNRTTYWTQIKSSMIVQDPTQIAGAAGGEAPEAGAGPALMPGLDAWGYPTTPSWSWGGGGGTGGGGGGWGGGGRGGGWGQFGGRGGGGENPLGGTTTPSWNSGGGGNGWNRWGLNSMGGGGWTTTQAPTRNTWAPSLFSSGGTGGDGGRPGGGGGRGGLNNGGSNSNGRGNNGNRGGFGRGNNPLNGGGARNNAWSSGSGSGNSGTNWNPGNGGGPGSASGGGGGGGRGGRGGGGRGGNWRPPNDWSANSNNGGQMGTNGGGTGGGPGNPGTSNTGGSTGGLNNWQLQLMKQLLGFKR